MNIVRNLGDVIRAKVSVEQVSYDADGKEISREPFDLTNYNVTVHSATLGDGLPKVQNSIATVTANTVEYRIEGGHALGHFAMRTSADYRVIATNKTDLTEIRTIHRESMRRS